MPAVFRTSSTTAGGTQNAISLGGRPSASAPSAAKHGFYDVVTTAQNDAGHTDYRCLFVYNNGTTDLFGVKVSVGNKGGGATVSVAASSVATNTHSTYATAVLASETSVPSISGSFGTSCVLGDLLVGQVRAVWFRRVTLSKANATSSDTFNVVAGYTEYV